MRIKKLKTAVPPRSSPRLTRKKDDTEKTETATKRGRKRGSTVSKEEPPNKKNRSVARSPSPPPLPAKSQKFEKKIVDGRVVDSYCWICHTRGGSIICKNCPRVYHQKCVKKKSSGNQFEVCECQQLTISGYEPSVEWDPAELKIFLKYVICNAIKEDKKGLHKLHKAEDPKICKYFRTWPIENNDQLLKIVDIDFLIDKLNTIPYHSTVEFFCDVKWIYHNSFILHGVGDITDTALKLEKKIKQELMDVEACKECYERKQNTHMYPDYFTEVCDDPHVIAWAKLKGSAYWPAKVLKIHNGHADVKFFGTHDKASVPVSQLYKISRAHPEGKSISKMLRLKEAVEELQGYILNYQDCFGSFQYSDKRVPFDETCSRGIKKRRKRGRGRRSQTEVKIVAPTPEVKIVAPTSNESESAPSTSHEDTTSTLNEDVHSTSNENIPEIEGRTIGDNPTVVLFRIEEKCDEEEVHSSEDELSSIEIEEEHLARRIETKEEHLAPIITKKEHSEPQDTVVCDMSFTEEELTENSEETLDRVMNNSNDVVHSPILESTSSSSISHSSLNEGSHFRSKDLPIELEIDMDSVTSNVNSSVPFPVISYLESTSESLPVVSDTESTTGSIRIINHTESSESVPVISHTESTTENIPVRSSIESTIENIPVRSSIESTIESIPVRNHQKSATESVSVRSHKKPTTKRVPVVPDPSAVSSTTSKTSSSDARTSTASTSNEINSEKTPTEEEEEIQVLGEEYNSELVKNIRDNATLSKMFFEMFMSCNQHVKDNFQWIQKALLDFFMQTWIRIQCNNVGRYNLRNFNNVFVKLATKLDECTEENTKLKEDNAKLQKELEKLKKDMQDLLTQKNHKESLKNEIIKATASKITRVEKSKLKWQEGRIKELEEQLKMCREELETLKRKECETGEEDIVASLEKDVPPKENEVHIPYKDLETPKIFNPQGYNPPGLSDQPSFSGNYQGMFPETQQLPTYNPMLQNFPPLNK